MSGDGFGDSEMDNFDHDMDADDDMMNAKVIFCDARLYYWRVVCLYALTIVIMPN